MPTNTIAVAEQIVNFQCAADIVLAFKYGNAVTILGKNDRSCDTRGSRADNRGAFSVVRCADDAKRIITKSSSPTANNITKSPMKYYTLNAVLQDCRCVDFAFVVL